jgi:hypothetical protein
MSTVVWRAAQGSSPEPTRPEGEAEHPSGYARLLHPLWGSGRIEMLLGAVVLDAAVRKNSG